MLILVTCFVLNIARYPWENKIVVSQLTPYLLCYLATLALPLLPCWGDVETLGSYSKSFMAGEKLGFDETIAKVHLEPTMVMVQEVKKAGKFSYDVLEQVAQVFTIDMDSFQLFRVRSLDLCNKKRAFHKK